MRILIVSDTHGRESNLERVLEEVGNIRHLIHLGDVEGQEDYIEAIADCPVHIVSGNNDFFSDLFMCFTAAKQYSIRNNHCRPATFF